MSPLAWAGLFAAGATGAPLRYLVDRAVTGRREGGFPWGTLTVNVTGSLLLGFLAGLALYHGFPATPRLLLGTGFCGAYTTFSTFTFETVGLVEEGAIWRALGNVVGTVLAGAVAAAVGLALAGW